MDLDLVLKLCVQQGYRVHRERGVPKFVHTVLVDMVHFFMFGRLCIDEILQ